MIGDVIDTFRTITPALNQKFVQRVQLKQLSATVSHAQKVDVSIMPI